MSVKAQYYKPGDVIDHTASGAVTGGNPTEVTTGVIGIPASDIADTDTDSLLVGKIIKIECDTSVGNIGDNIWYDSNGSPYGGTASSGAATTIASSGDYWLGTLAAATGATDTHAYVRLNTPNINLPAWPEKTHLVTAADLTLTAADHSGGVIHVTKDAGTDTKITLPVGVEGMEWIIQNDEADGGNLLQVDLNGNEIIEGINLTIAATKLALNTKATSIRGDYIHLVCNVAATSWRCVAKRGIWATST